ncbi:glutathione S-transferase family protein [Roseomonas fluvialis]|uniref:glutathione S-transferase family protein n=1 Tax=Roseomonas fluvialis TaxID=1750527 RepID=UPI001FCDCE7F|nr:glutathione S-transferase [Roseomonas fluvialis]
MRFFYAPNACSIGIHVILEEIGRPYDPAPLDFKNNAQYEPGYVAINPKSKVPALLRDDGTLLTEYPVIAMWLAKTNPQAGLVPVDLEGETRCAEFLDYVCGTVHPQGFTRQSRPNRFALRAEDEPAVVAQGRELAVKYMNVIDSGWRGDTWVLPGGYSIADSALFFIEHWAARRFNIPLPPRLATHFAAMLARPAVKRTLELEGLPT